MTAYINKLKDKTGNQQLPATHERAVRDNNGTTLETKMQNLEGAMDKAYVASSDNGMGRITLKKNMVSGVNTLTQSMMQATNTIYIIRYDFTLGEDITVPANCVLEFDGGSISNEGSNTYSLTSQNTQINAPSEKIFGDNILFRGVWNCTFNVYWFGCKGDRANPASSGLTCTDNSPYFENLLNAVKTIGSGDGSECGVSIFFPRGNYFFSREIILSPIARNFRNWNYAKTYEIYGESKNATTLVWSTEQGMSNTTRMLDVYIHDLAFHNVGVDSINRFNSVADRDAYVSNGYAIKLTNPEYTSKIENCFFRNWYSAVELSETYGQFTFDSCITSRCIYGFVASGCNGINFTNVSINFAYEAGIFLTGTLAHIDSLCVEGCGVPLINETYSNNDEKFHGIGISAISSRIISSYIYEEMILIGTRIKNASVTCDNYDFTELYNIHQESQTKINNGTIKGGMIDFDGDLNGDAVMASMGVSKIRYIGAYLPKVYCNINNTAPTYNFQKMYYNASASEYKYYNNWLIIEYDNNVDPNSFLNSVIGNAVPMILSTKNSSATIKDAAMPLPKNLIGTLHTRFTGHSTEKVASIIGRAATDTFPLSNANLKEVGLGTEVGTDGVITLTYYTVAKDGSVVSAPLFSLSPNGAGYKMKMAPGVVLETNS